MLDAHLRPFFKGPLEKLAKKCSDAGIKPNHITWSGFVIGLFGAVAIVKGDYTIGLMFILINRLFDGLDGALAEFWGATDMGGLLDIALDFIFYASIPFAFGIHQLENQMPALFVMFSFFACGGIFLAYGIIAAKRGREERETEHHGFSYIHGLIEGAEVTFFFTLMCLLPDHFPMLAYAFGGLCLVTAAMRIRFAYSVFGKDHGPT